MSVTVPTTCYRWYDRLVLEVGGTFLRGGIQPGCQGNMSKRTRREESRLRINGEIADYTSMIDNWPLRKQLAPSSTDLTPRVKDNRTSSEIGVKTNREPSPYLQQPSLLV
jgi:hypothetical protein